MKTHRGWLTLTVVIGCLLLSEAQVEFPLDYYSFPEIAQRMSVEGRKIECARDLQQRLALIRLKSRPWQQARELLEAALDVRFRKISDAENRWILERDPEVVRKERRWREQFAAYVEKRRAREAELLRMMMDKSVPVEEVVKLVLEAYKENTDLSEVADEAQLKAQFTQVIEYFRKFPMEQALRDWRAFQRMQKRLSEFLQRDFTVGVDENDPFGFYRRFLAENPLSSFGFSQEILNWAQRAATDERDETLKMFREAMGNIGMNTSADPQLMQMMLLNSLGMFAAGYGQAWARDLLVAQLRPPITALETLEQGAVVRDYTVALPPEQLAWHLNDVDGVQIPLNSPTPIPTSLVAVANWDGFSFSVNYYFPEARPRSDFLGLAASNILDSVGVRLSPDRLQRLLPYLDTELARAYEQAYALHNQLVNQPPVNQAIKASLTRNTSLIEVAYRWAQEHRQEVVMEMMGVLRWNPEATGNSLMQRLTSSYTPFLLEQRDGVWVLRCWTAFLERVGDYPYAAIRDLLRSDYRYEAWQRFYRTVNAEQARWLLAARWRQVWNLHEKPGQHSSAIRAFDLGAAWLITAILESLPAEQRERFWNPPADTPKLTLELAQLPLEARTRIAHTLKLWRAALISEAYGPDSAALLMPPDTWLRRLILHREYGEWQLKTVVGDPASGESEEVELFSANLPAKNLAPVEADDETLINWDGVNYP
jgi:hypothetical protein